MKKIPAAGLLVALMLCCHGVRASTHPVLDFGIARGGDKVAGASFFVGGDSSIHAGDAYYINAGVLHRFPDSNWGFKSTVGYSFAAIPRYGDNFSFRRVPLEFISIYGFGDQNFGFGITCHINPWFDGNGHTPDIHYRNAVGMLLQYQYRVFGVRYTHIRYKAQGTPGNPTLDASSIGLFLTVRFGE
ncbi:MAG TPA: hypothetical protein VFM15_04400 [Gammaproteobacteria bacterium]|nr:hypothetical protein [Gammaproteobacteria bacterium]